MKLPVLGKGCSKCHQVEENAREALDETGGGKLETIYDITEASTMGMMEAPGLAIDGDVRVQGRVPESDEIRELIEDE